MEFGERAEEISAEFRQLNSVFALSLQPHPPHPDTKRKLLQAIRQMIHRDCEQDGHYMTNNPALREGVTD
jgi:hypothetical protein